MSQDKRWQNTQDLTNTKHLGNIHETYLGENTLHHYTIRPLHSRQKRELKPMKKHKLAPNLATAKCIFQTHFCNYIVNHLARSNFFTNFGFVISLTNMAFLLETSLQKGAIGPVKRKAISS